MTKPFPFSQDKLKQILAYDAKTGKFTWRVKPSITIAAGKEAGSVTQAGYISISIKYKRYLAHRLAWFYVHGSVPDIMDHINGSKADNRICNLRPATKSENNHNKVPVTGASSSLRGVTNDRGRWKAQIRKDGKHIYLGMFGDEESAHDAYCAAAREHFGEFARTK